MVFWRETGAKEDDEDVVEARDIREGIIVATDMLMRLLACVQMKVARQAEKSSRSQAICQLRARHMLPNSPEADRLRP